MRRKICPYEGRHINYTDKTQSARTCLFQWLRQELMTPLADRTSGCCRPEIETPAKPAGQGRASQPRRNSGSRSKGADEDTWRRRQRPAPLPLPELQRQRSLRSCSGEMSPWQEYAVLSPRSSLETFFVDQRLSAVIRSSGRAPRFSSIRSTHPFFWHAHMKTGEVQLNAALTLR